MNVILLPFSLLTKEGGKFYRSFSIKRGLLSIVVWSFFISIVFVVSLYFAFVKDLPQKISQFTETVAREYPPDLRIEIKNGILSKNITSPVVLYPIYGAKNTDLLQYWVAVDDSKIASYEAYKELRSGVLLAKDGAVFPEENGAVTIMPYEKITLNLDKVSFVNFVQKVNSYVKHLPEVFVLSVILFYVILKPLMYMIGLFFIAWAVYIFRKRIFGHKMLFKEVYKIIVFVGLPVYLVKELLFFFPFVSWYLFTCISVAVVLFYALKHKKLFAHEHEDSGKEVKELQVD